jgi:hypothetical protein
MMTSTTAAGEARAAAVQAAAGAQAQLQSGRLDDNQPSQTGFTLVTAATDADAGKQCTLRR